MCDVGLAAWQRPLDQYVINSAILAWVRSVSKCVLPMRACAAVYAFQCHCSSKFLVHSICAAVLSVHISKDESGVQVTC